MRALTILLAGVLGLMLGCQRQEVVVAASIDHDDLTALLTKYVDARGLIDYDGWRASTVDRQRLNDYLQQYAQVGAVATGAERHAGLLNAYNAFTIAEVLTLNPEKSFWDHSPFGKRKYDMAGVLVSLDDIEHGAVRDEVGYRGHAALVCAAMSCPPLPQQAFTGENLDAKLDERMRIWLARTDLNKFNTNDGSAEVSKIFSWFHSDFSNPGLAPILQRYAPQDVQSVFTDGGPSISYMAYDKKLNKQ